MPVTWTAYHGEPTYDLLAILEDVLSNWTDLDADETQATVSTAEASVEIKGEIELGMPGEPVGGTVHVIKVYVGETLIAKATGYDLDIDDIGDAFDAAEMGDFSLFEALFFDVPLTFNGSADDDTFADGDFASTFFGNGGDDRFEGNGGADDMFGGDGRDVLFGGNGADLLKGNDGHDALIGGNGANIIKGGDGGDYLGGGDGTKMTGGSGNDMFGLDLDGVVKITDFQPGNDTLVLNPEAFGVSGDLEPEEFHIGNNAHDADDRFIYNDNTGALFFDEDGDGATAKVKIAELDAGLPLSADDFFSGYIVI